jgi:hypothetical protein
MLAGAQTASATVTGLKPVTFTANAVAGAPTQIILSRDTVQLLGVGDTFRLNARVADQFGNTIVQATTVESDDPSIVTADNLGNGAILTARASDKTTTVRASAGSLHGNGGYPPAAVAEPQSFNLAVGQIGFFPV